MDTRKASSKTRLALVAVLLCVLSLAAAAPPARAGIVVGLRIGVPLLPPPPPAQVVVVRPGPGFVWVQGHWGWAPARARYVWAPGVWVRPPFAGAVWVGPRWGWHRGSRFFVHGYWR